VIRIRFEDLSGRSAPPRRQASASLTWPNLATSVARSAMAARALLLAVATGCSDFREPATRPSSPIILSGFHVREIEFELAYLCVLSSCARMSAVNIGGRCRDIRRIVRRRQTRACPGWLHVTLESRYGAASRTYTKSRNVCVESRVAWKSATSSNAVFKVESVFPARRVRFDQPSSEPNAFSVNTEFVVGSNFPKHNRRRFERSRVKLRFALPPQCVLCELASAYVRRAYSQHPQFSAPRVKGHKTQRAENLGMSARFRYV